LRSNLVSPARMLYFTRAPDDRKRRNYATKGTRIMIKVGDRLPEAKFRIMTAEGPAVKTTDEIFKGKKVVLFAVPGAFTPTCHKNHLPGFVQKADAIKSKGIDTIAVTGVNDVFVMDAWKKASGAEGKIEFLSDGNGDFAKAIDLWLDGSAMGLGVRSKRYSMVVEDGVVKKLNVEEAPGKADVSGAENLLKQF
jgi:glutaredoxin/glutathione-dependent peroxiredoxin